MNWPRGGKGGLERPLAWKGMTGKLALQLGAGMTKRPAAPSAAQATIRGCGTAGPGTSLVKLGMARLEHLFLARPTIAASVFDARPYVLLNILLIYLLVACVSRNDAPCPPSLWRRS